MLTCGNAYQVLLDVFVGYREEYCAGANQEDQRVCLARVYAKRFRI